MKTTNENPWENLETPSDRLITSIRIGAEYPYDFYFAKNSAGKFMLVFSFSKPMIIRDKILLNGISVASISANDSPSMTLTLKSNTDWPIFLKICLDLCHIASEATDEEKAVDLFCKRLLYWQFFLKHNNEDKLSKEEQIGLVAELLFLEKYLLSQYYALDAVNFWTGPDEDAQDFFIGRKRIEIKACASPSKNEIHISSLQQLYDTDCEIYLAVAYIGVAASNADDAFSLFSLASRIAENLQEENIAAYELFVKKLALTGLFLDGTYNDVFYIANKCKGFRVHENFPRITPKDVKDGVSKANYVINLNSCSDYEIELKKIFAKE